MTSVMALFWALEPSAESFPAGQARPDAFALLPGSAPPGWSFALVGSEPQATRARVATAARAARSPVTYDRVGRKARERARRFMIMLVLHRLRAISSWRTPAPRCAAGLAREARACSH